MMYNKTYNTLLGLSLFVITSVSVSLFTSCNDNEETYPRKYIEQRIVFASPVVDGISRGAAITDTEQGQEYSEGETFRVYAAYYAPGSKSFSWSKNSEYNPTEGAVVSYSDEYRIWDTPEPHMWKKGKVYAFKGYSPANINDGQTVAGYDTESNGGLTIKNFRIPEMGSQYDLMYIPAMYDVEGPELDIPNKISHYNGVNLVFKHALSSVHFKVCVNPSYLRRMTVAQAAEEAARYKIQSITLSGLNNEADFNENSTAEYNGSTGKWSYVGCAEDSGIEMWSNWKFDADAAYEFVTDEIKEIPYMRGGTVSEAARSIRELNPSNHIAFMIPQKLDARASITVKWTYADKENKLNENTSVIYLNDSTKNDVVSSRWEMGKRYTYTIALAKDRIFVKPSAGKISGSKNVEIE